MNTSEILQLSILLTAIVIKLCFEMSVCASLSLCRTGDQFLGM